MNLSAKITWNCLQQWRNRSSILRCYYETAVKRNLVVSQRLHHSSQVICKGTRNSFLLSKNVAACTRDKYLFQRTVLFYFSQRFSSSAEVAGVHKNVSPLPSKKRIPRKKSTLDQEQELMHKDKWLVVAYTSAEEYDLHATAREIKKHGVYKILPLPEDAGEVLHVSANYQVGKEPRHIYFFSEGSVVFWNVPELEQQSVLEFLKPYEMNSYNEALYNEEKEDLEYSYGEDEARLSNGLIVMNENLSLETTLDPYAFSNAMVLSVKLALWEATLESFVDSIEWVTVDMKCGKKINMSREQVFQKRGELFALRHAINLGSDLLDTPDFYWDRQNLEILYQQTCNHLNIAKRTKVMNERLNYCSELIDLLGNHMNDKHHVRLEWMIIALIMVEVMFECVHFISRIYE